MVDAAASYWTRNQLPDPTGTWTCIDVFRAAPSERLAMIKAGAPARWVKATLGDFIRGCGPDVSLLKLSGATLNRQAVADARLPLAESARAVGLAGMIGRVEAMVCESGAADGLGASIWLAGWATSPLPALGGERPIEYLDTWEGREIISQLLAQMQSSAYA